MNQRFAFHFSLLGTGLLLAGIAQTLLHPIIAVGFYWSALNVFLMAVGYRGMGARLLGKRRSGRLSLSRAVLFFPLMTAAFLVWNSFRFLRKEEPFGWVTKDICIGRRLSNSEPHPDVDIVVDLTAEFNEPSAMRRLGHYVSFPILDGSIPPVADLIAAIDALPEGSVYVHCAQGHGRASLFTIALLARSGQAKSVDEATDAIRKVRPMAQLNRCQRAFLDDAFPLIVKEGSSILTLSSDSPCSE